MAEDHFFSGITTPFSATAAAAAFGYYTLDQPADSSATAHFDSALSSLVSSPTNAAPAPFYPVADIAIGDLIGRLGSICNGSTTNASCYSTPLSSPRYAVPLLPGLPVCRAQGGGLPETGKLSRVSSSKSMALESSNAAQHEMEVKAMGSPQAKAAGGGGTRKRKAPAKGKAESFSPMIIDKESDLGMKRPKLSTAAGGDAGTGVTENNGGGNAERKEEMSDGDAKAAAPEPPKDYIHVRARRGQATDSHSLAERVRRERISERMKMLQSLVPGCDKVTGKALMLDEIINYVQSLQRQAEFLSMKVATMNPQLDYNGHYLYTKDMHQSTTLPTYLTEDMATVGFSSHSADLEAISHVNSNLQSVLQMGTGQSQEIALSLQNFYSKPNTGESHEG